MPLSITFATMPASAARDQVCPSSGLATRRRRAGLGIGHGVSARVRDLGAGVLTLIVFAGITGTAIARGRSHRPAARPRVTIVGTVTLFDEVNAAVTGAGRGRLR